MENDRFPPDRIEVGDVVQLASGSPRMTVFAIRKGRASVVWNHYPTGVVREQAISLKALVKPAPKQSRRYSLYTESPLEDAWR